jgi:hypothetical protein
MIKIYTCVCVCSMRACAQVSAATLQLNDIAPVTVTAVSNTQDVPFIVSQSRAALSRRKPACSGTCRDSYRLRGHDKRNTV